MCSHLHRAPHGTYYFRISVPAELRPFLGGKREIKKSLRLKDREAAKLLIPDHTKAAHSLFAQAQRDRDAANAPAPKSSSRKSRDQRDREQANWEGQQEQFELQAQAADDLDSELEALEPIMDALASGREVNAPAAEIARAARLTLLHEREMANIERIELVSRLVPRHSIGRASENQMQIVECSGDAVAAPNAIYLDTDIVGGWAAERKPSAKGKAAYESSARLFHSIMGRKSVKLITKADVMAYKKKLIADPTRSQTNVRDHLGYLRTLLDWAAQNDVIEANPAKDVRMRVTEKGEARKDFDIDDLTALFAGPVHAKGERPKGCGGEAAYWLPLLALFMGARREELGQLRVGDVRQAPYVDGNDQRQQVWCIDITDASNGEALANQVKNASSRRLIPLHPKLIELGFIKYVEKLDKTGRVFPALKPVGVGQKLTDKWGQWFGRYKLACGIVDKKKVFHSFRHTWKTYAVDADIHERVCRQFQGHEGKDAADKYGTVPSMHVLVAAIASFRIPGLELSPPK